jgi:dihydrofolate reductase
VAKLIMWNLMTLDGFVEGPGQDISWHHDVWGSELEQLSIEQLNNAGALLFGRVTYELMANYWPTATGEAGEIANIMNRIPKFVFSRTLTRSDWHNVTFFSGDAAKTVTNLKRETVKDIYLFGSADLAASLIPQGLFDEIRIGLSPHILGSGTPLFKHADRRQRLKLLEARPLSSGITILRYQPTA